MAGTTAVDGLVSGLSTSALIDQLMSIEAQPQTDLKNKVAETNTFISDLQGLNSKVAALTTAATNASKTGGWDLFKATSSATSVTATAGAGATEGSLTFQVNAIAQAQTSVSASVTSLSQLFSGNPPQITLTKADGTAFSVTAVDSSDVEILAAINNSGAGVKASLVPKAADGTYRLQITSTSTGAASAFSVSTGAPGATTPVAFTQTSAAQDASVTLYAGTAVATNVTSSTNTFSNLAPGVAVTISKVETDPVTVQVASDATATQNQAKSIFDALGAVFTEISTKSAVTTTANADGTTAVTGGVYTADSAVQDISQQLLDAASAPVNGKSPASIGIAVNRDGSIDFSTDTFAAALASDPIGTRAMLATITSRLASTSNAISDPQIGSLSTEIQSQQSEVRDLNNQVTDWDARLEVRRQMLETTYSNLEVTLSNLKAQGSYLTSQLSSLSTAN